MLPLIVVMFYYINGKQETMKKLTFMIIVLFLGNSLILSQDLVIAAQKEKERRAKLKKKSAIVVTNADLYKTERAKTLRITLPEKQSSTIQRATPQKTQRTTSSKPSRLQKRKPSQQIDNIDQIDFNVDKVDQMDQLEVRGFRSDYATQVLNTTEYVENPQLALDKPDGQYAEIGEFGSLDIKIDVKNRNGDDIAIFAKRQKEGQQNENRNYGVFVEYRGEWEFIGFGGGITSPETFDLGEIQSAKKIRLLFKDFTRSMWTAKPYQHQQVAFSMGIDAVKSLHR
jgi:preprotein translocase subunit SecG